jgi:hypothetical protein
MEKSCFDMIPNILITINRFDNAVALTKKAALRSHLRRMAFRLEAAVMFVKNRLKLDE